MPILATARSTNCEDNVNIYKLSESDILILSEMLSRADANGQDVRIAVDGGLKVKVGGGMWTWNMGYKE